MRTARDKKHECLGRTGQGKVPHRTREGAMLHAEHLNETRKWPFFYDAYECRFCGYWHIGGPPQPSWLRANGIKRGHRSIRKVPSL